MGVGKTVNITVDVAIMPTEVIGCRQKRQNIISRLVTWPRVGGGTFRIYEIRLNRRYVIYGTWFGEVNTYWGVLDDRRHDSEKVSLSLPPNPVSSPSWVNSETVDPEIPFVLIQNRRDIRSIQDILKVFLKLEKFFVYFCLHLSTFVYFCLHFHFQKLVQCSCRQKKGDDPPSLSLQR